MARLAVLAVALLAGSALLASATEYTFNFDESLEGNVARRGNWKWAARSDLDYQVPEGCGGFAVFQTPGVGDDFWSEDISAANGLNYSMTFYAGSRWPNAAHIQIRRLTRGSSDFIDLIDDLSEYSGPLKRDWITVTGYVPPMADTKISVYCQIDDENPNGDGSWLWGCVVDNLVIITPGEETTTAGPTTTTEEPTTTTVTTQEPPNYIDFNFENGTDDWVLGRSNGATWIRTAMRPNGVDPPNGRYNLKVYPTEYQSGVVLAMSPRLVAGIQGKITMAVTFFLNGSPESVASLKFRRTSSFASFDEYPTLNLDAYGDNSDDKWVTHMVLFENVTPGEEFNIVMEANLGPRNYENLILVSRIQLEGAEYAQVQETSFFDFSGGLIGWTGGSLDGGRWLVYNYSEIDVGFIVPPPTIGDNILIVDRFDVHAGVISIESPPILFEPGTTKQMNLKFWMRGTQNYPTSLRIRRKTVDGIYDTLPFLDLTPYGNVNNLRWLELTNFWTIPTEGIRDYFQLVIEADLGAFETNLVAIDAIRIQTFVIVPEEHGSQAPANVGLVPEVKEVA